jgi:hypothetical protein
MGYEIRITYEITNFELNFFRIFVKNSYFVAQRFLLKTKNKNTRITKPTTAQEIKL